MTSDAYTPPEQIVSKLDVTPSDLLLVGSDVLQLAVQIRAAGGQFDANAFIDDLLAKLGPEGTLLFPTFNFDFCRGETFDVRTTPTAMGSLPRAALKRADFRRTKHPLHSFVVAGKHQDEICALENVSSTGTGSPFEFMLNNNGKMIIIGLPMQGAFTFAHYVEETEGVDFRYHKEFTSTYIDYDGKSDERTYTLYVRDLERGVLSDLNPMQEILVQENVVFEKVINGISFLQLRFRETYPYIVQDIRENGGKSLYRLESD